MSDKVQGRVEFVNKNNSGYYNLKIDGEYYGAGKFAPRGVEQGDMVEFEVEYNGNYKNIARGSLRKVEGSSAPPAPRGSGPKQYSKGGGFDERQDVISKQAALNTALEFLRFAKESETIPVPKTKNAGFGYLKQLWLEEASFLYNLNTGKEWDVSEAVAVDDEAPKPAKKAAKKAAPPPPAEEDEWEDDDIPF